MKVQKMLVVDQKSERMEKLAEKNGTTYGICGFVTCALTRYLANLPHFDPSDLKNLNASKLSPHIEVVMKEILVNRRIEVLKYEHVMNQSQKKNYLRDWMANYEIADYMTRIYEQVDNQQIYFFRQSAFDHSQALSILKFEEKERVEQERPFKGHKFFYSSFGPYKNHFKQQFEDVLRKADKSKPVIIATDILGHFYTTLLFQGQIYILDSLNPMMTTRCDSPIVECIETLYKQSYLIKENHYPKASSHK